MLRFVFQQGVITLKTTQLLYLMQFVHKIVTYCMTIIAGNSKTVDDQKRIIFHNS